MMNFDEFDYLETEFNIKQKYKKLRGGYDQFTAEELERIPQLRLHLKNAVMYYVLEQRIYMKNNALFKILAEGVSRISKQKRQQNLWFKEASNFGLKDRLEVMQSKENRISEDQFNYLKRATKDFGVISIKETMLELNRLQKAIEQDLKKVVGE